MDKIGELRSEIEENRKLPIGDIYNQIRSLTLSYYVFQTNYAEMVTKITISPEASIHLHSFENQADFENVTREVIRLLHNFLASAKTLVDHTRIAVDRLYGETEFFNEYNEKKDKLLVKNPLQVFIQDLRNYAQHYTLPIVGSNLSFSRDAGFSHSWILDFRNFSPNYSWKALSKQFMEAASKPQMPLQILSEDYYDLIQEFYEWFGNRQHDLHGEEIENAVSTHNHLQKELDAATQSLINARTPKQ